MKKKDKQYIELLKKGDRQVLSEIYSSYFDACYSWVRKNFSADKEDFNDVFQDAVIALYEAAVDHKLDDVSCSLKTYLFAVCRNLLMKKMRLQKNIDMKVEEVAVHFRDWVDESDESQEKIALMKEEVNTMGEPCRSILTHFYYHNLDLEEIKEKMDYPNANVVKVQKSRCLKYLREKMQKAWSRTLN